MKKPPHYLCIEWVGLFKSPNGTTRADIDTVATDVQQNFSRKDDPSDVTEYLLLLGYEESSLLFISLEDE